MELLFEVCKCTLKKRTFICVTSFEKYAIGSYLLIFVIDSICMIFVKVMSAPWVLFSCYVINNFWGIDFIP